MNQPFRLVLALALGALSLFGSPVGSISGTIKDPSGAVIPSAQLTLTSNSTNQLLKTTSNAQGEFQFLELAPTTYSLVAEASGFKKINVSSIVVQVDQTTHLELKVEVGNTSESVQVEGAA